MAVEEIRNVTWNLEGDRLQTWQLAQRLHRAKFQDIIILRNMVATLCAESGRFLKAWHHNVEHNDDGTIKRNDKGEISILSTDLGVAQINVVEPTTVLDYAAAEYAHSLFEKHPALARGDDSASIAHEYFMDRGYQPWVAFDNGSYKKFFGEAAFGIGNYLAVYGGLKGDYLKVA